MSARSSATSAYKRRGAGREGLAKAALILGVIAFIINVALIIIGAAGGFGD